MPPAARNLKPWEQKKKGKWVDLVHVLKLTSEKHHKADVFSIVKAVLSLFVDSQFTFVSFADKCVRYTADSVYDYNYNYTCDLYTVLKVVFIIMGIVT